MKKVLLAAGMLALTLSLSAQQRLVLYEEFSGENCGPCALYNPGLWTLLSNNSADILLIKYQSPIPSAGPIYEQNTVDIQNRMSYYSVPFAPYGRMDGVVSPGGQNNGNIASLTQAHITAAKNIASHFNISVSTPIVTPATSLTPTITATVTVNAVTAYNGTNVKLRAALVESLFFDTPPGTNGETDFHHVVRKMYPNGDGQASNNNWTANQTATYTITGEIPAYVDKAASDLFLVVWLQEDGDKTVLQAAKSSYLPAPLVDVASKGISVPTGDDLLCGTPNAITPIVTIKNTGTTPLTSATIYYQVSGGAWENQPWVGNLAANATLDVPLTTPVSASAGLVTIIDSVALPNGLEDINPVNNTNSMRVSVVSNTNGQTLPVSTDFETNTNSWVPYAKGTDRPLYIYSLTNKGYNGSSKAAAYLCYGIQSGSGYMVLPYSDIPSGPKALDFYVAYTQYQSENDKLEVVYSTDCGVTWSSVWSKAGAALRTVPPKTAQFIPANNSEWRMESVDMTGVPANAQIAFKATSNYGNNMFIDNVNFRTGQTNAISNVEAGIEHASIYPNPTKDLAYLTVNSKESVLATVTITDAMGRTLGNNIQVKMNAGQNSITIPTKQLANGMYFVNLNTEKGNLVFKLQVIK